MKISGFTDLSELTLLVLQKFSSRFPSGNGEERLARFIGDIAYTVPWGPHRMIANRLSMVFGSELTLYQIKRLTREVFRNRWANREVLWLQKFSSSAFKRKTACQRIRVEGLEHLSEAISRGKGMILWESSFGKRVLAKVVLLEKGFSLCQVHGPEHGGSPTWLGQRVIRSIYRKAAGKLFLELIDIQYDSFAYLRRLANRLKQNGIVCMPGLGGEGHKFVPVQFLGARQQFATGVVSLARMTGASLIPIFCFKQDDGMDHLVLEKPINLECYGDGDE
nr:hypothetical protein [bacterium]